MSRANDVAASAREPVLVLAMATTGRKDIVSEVAPYLALQTRLPDAMLVCVAQDDDVDPEVFAALPFECVVIKSAKGLTRQRNCILDEIATRQPQADIVLFIDDDFVLSPTFIAETVRLFALNPGVVVATGRVLADGIKTRGIDVATALSIIATDAAAGQTPRPPRDIYNAYGCNMAIRLAPVRRHRLRFDEALPLYSWLEDIDFSRELAGYGRIVHSETLRGVHLGTKRGRTSGLRFGYSQIANPIYLAGKRSMTPRRAFIQIGRNLLANCVRLLRPEPWLDRRGRLFGNLLALRDLLRGTLSPVNILRLS